MAQDLAELSVAEQHMVSNLAENWWALVIRGAAGVLFGIAALVWPPGAVTALVLLFGAYALVDGIFNLIAAFRAPREGKRWGWLAFSGVTGVATGLIAFFFPGITAVARVANPMSTTVNTVSRTWTDLNGNFAPDCDLRDQFAGNVG